MSKIFHMIRERDVSGISGTGKVLEGIQFSDGTIVVRWLSKHASTAVYNNIEEFEAIHGHDGAGKIVWEKTYREGWNDAMDKAHWAGLGPL